MRLLKVPLGQFALPVLVQQLPFKYLKKKGGSCALKCPYQTTFMGHESALKQPENALLENIHLSTNMYFSNCSF